MTTLLGDAYVRLRPDTTHFEREAKGTFGGIGKKAALAFGAAFAAVGVGGMLKGAINEASDLGESINAVNVSFGNAAKGVLNLGENAARAVGLSNREFNALAVRFSSFSKTIAGEGGNVTQTLQDLTGRASDFASVMNLDVSKAAELFQSGLAGETEPLRAFGIDLSAAAVEAHAYATGIAEAGSTMTEAQKVQARYSLLMEQTAQTANDFKNTSDSLANSQRILGAEWDNLTAKAGNFLVPALASITSTISTSVLPAFEELGPKIGTFFSETLPSVIETNFPDFFTFGERIVNRIKFGMESGNWSSLVDYIGNAIGLDIDSSSAFNFGERIINRIEYGFQSGNWAPLWDFLLDAVKDIDTQKIADAAGNMIGGLAQGLVESAATIGGAIIEVVGRIDWGGIALEFGKMAPTVLLGFATGLLSEEAVTRLFGWVADNWFTVLMSFIGLAFAPLKVINVFAKILDKIPLVGPFLSWALLHLKTWADNIMGWLGRAAGSFGKKLADSSPVVVGGIVRWFDDIWTRVYVWGDDLLKWFGALPGRIGGRIGEAAGDVASGIGRMIEKLKGPLQGMLGWLNTHFIGNVNKVTEKFGLKIPNVPIPGFHTGGVVPGGYSPGKDTTLAAVGAGEAIMRPEWTRAMGAEYVNAANRAARAGGVGAVRKFIQGGGPAFAAGGIYGSDALQKHQINNTSSTATRAAVDNGIVGPGLDDLFAKGISAAVRGLLSPLGNTARKMPPEILGGLMGGIVDKSIASLTSWGEDKQSAELAGGAFSKFPGAYGKAVRGKVAANTAAAVEFVRRTWGINNIGTLGSRPNKSDHPMGKALDVMIPNYRSAQGIALGNAIANYFVQNAKEFGTKYVIWRQKINSGSGWRGMADRGGDTANHFDHPHISLYDQGGIVKPGLSAIYNATGKPEAIFTNEQARALLSIASQGGGAPEVRVYIGDREITDIVRTEVLREGGSLATESRAF